MEKPRKLTTRQYVGLVRDINSRMTQMPPLFNENQQLDESELMDYLANKAPRSHKEIMILQGFNPETGYIATLIEHCKWAYTTDKISMANFLPQTKIATPRKKSVPIRLRNVRKT